MKISFDTERKDSALLFDEFEEKVMNALERHDNTSFNVYIKNLMPIREMDNVVKELCDTIKWHFNCEAKSVRHEECIAADYIDMYSSATYVIEITT